VCGVLCGLIKCIFFLQLSVAIGLLFQTEIRAKQMLADLDRSLAGNSMSVLPLPQYTAEAHKMDVDVDAKESSPQRGSTH
jgi:hypothetical protein